MSLDPGINSRGVQGVGEALFIILKKHWPLGGLCLGRWSGAGWSGRLLTWCGYGGSRQGRGALRRGAVGTLRSGRGSTPDCSIKGLQGHGAGARDWEERCVQMDELETRDSRQATPVQLGLCTALCSS